MAKVIEILVAQYAKKPLYNLEKCKVIKNRGIIGDRYFNNIGSYSKKLKDKNDFHVTLIEKEEIDSFNKLTGLNYENRLFRRNIVTTGIKLNNLIGREFEVNGVKLFGMRLCEPCKMLADDLGEEFLTKMIHKSGLRAKVISSGIINIGDEIKCL